MVGIRTASAILVLAALVPSPAAAEGAAAIELGVYECWAFNTPQMDLNFTVTGPDTYTGIGGEPGTFGYDPSSAQMTFQSGPLAGVMPNGFIARYEVREFTGPTVSFVSDRGAEAAFCEKV
jgi:hypothetical protein